MLLSEKTALVLDGEDGIGAAITYLLRTEGATVFSTTPRDAEVGPAFDQARASLGGVDILVNAMSDWTVDRPQAWTADQWRELSERNGAAAVSSAQVALEGLRRPGSVCFISTVWSLATSPEMGLVGASKAAVGPITKALALAGAAEGLRANAVVTGLIDTPALRDVAGRRSQMGAAQRGGASLFEETSRRVPMRRAGTALEVAKVVAFLCSDHARMINGASVVVDGGLLYA